MKFLLSFICTVALLSSCTRDRDLSGLKLDTDSVSISTGIIKINEFVAKGSENINEFGITSDWFELYNTSNKTISMANGRWYVTDNLTAPRKYEMPAVTIKPHGFLVVWCDGINKYASQVHSNFNLSASGEQIGIFFSITDQILMAVDTLSYPVMTVKGFSYGRLPDGSDNWTYFSKSTPGEQNHY